MGPSAVLRSWEPSAAAACRYRLLGIVVHMLWLTGWALCAALLSHPTHETQHEVVERHRRLRGILDAHGYHNHCGLRYEPHNTTVNAIMLAYARTFLELAPGGGDPPSREGEEALTALVSDHVGQIGFFGVRWAPSLLGVSVHHVTQHHVGIGATRRSLATCDCRSCTEDKHNADVSHLLILAAAQTEEEFRDVGFLHGVLRAGVAAVAQGRRHDDAARVIWEWQLSSRGCGPLVADALFRKFTWHCMHGLGHAMAVFHGLSDDALIVAAQPMVDTRDRIDWATKGAADWAALQAALANCAALEDLRDRLPTPLSVADARMHAHSCATGAWMEYQTQKGNPYPLCIELGCAQKRGDLATDCWNRHWEGCRRTIPTLFHSMWMDEPSNSALAPYWAQAARGCAALNNTIDNAQRCMMSFGQWLAVALVNADEFSPPVSEWHLHRAIALCEAPGGWDAAYMKSAAAGHQVTAPKQTYSTACSAGVYGFWKSQNNGATHPRYANASTCAGEQVTPTCKFWYPRRDGSH